MENNIPSPVKAQNKLGLTGLIILLASTYIYLPISIDMVLPTLPTIQAELQASSGHVNMLLSAFLLFFTLGILILGPLSDKYGRKFMYIFGLSIYNRKFWLCIF